MHIEDQGIVIKISRFQESSLIVDCFTCNYGIIRGLAKSKNSAAQAVPASLVHIIYKARLESQLGVMQLEGVRNYASLFGFSRLKLRLANCILWLLNVLLREGDAHPQLYQNTLAFLEELFVKENAISILKAYALWELEIMKESGYGLDLTRCVVTDSVDNLVYISPRSGCAVSEEPGRPYHNKLFKLPQFYLNPASEFDDNDVLNALDINEFFLRKRIFEHNNSKLILERYNLRDLFNQVKAV